MLVRVRDLTVSFRLGKGRSADAVRGVSFDVPPDRAVALVGESGSGKSVSALSIVRLLPENAIVAPQSSVEYQGSNLLREPVEHLRALRGRDFSMVFQEPMSSLNPVFTVGEQIAEVLRRHLALPRRHAFARAAELLDEVGIPDPTARLGAYPHELSGGQQQRVMIAMAIACQPKLLIADEPTTALDVTVQRQILDLLARLRQSHAMSLLFISHDLALVGEIADEVVVMRAGEVRESGSVQRIFSAPQDPYTKALLACRPRLDAKPRRLPVIDDFLSDSAPLADRPARRAQPAVAQPLLEATGLCKTYRLRTGLFARKTIDAVRDVSFRLARGRTLGVVGESGSGKTTLGMLLMHLVEASGGKVLFDGTELLALSEGEMMAFRRRIQLIFQNPYASLNPRFTVGRILIEPMKIHGIGSDERERFERAIALLGRVGMPPDSILKYPHEFSGGQRQRIAIARCLAMRPEIIICDEAVSALDVSVQATVLNLLLDLQDEFQLTYLFISHDLAVVKYMADEIIVMHEGEVVEAGDAEALYAAPAHPYTKKLLSAIPRGYAARGREAWHSLPPASST